MQWWILWLIVKNVGGWSVVTIDFVDVSLYLSLSQQVIQTDTCMWIYTETDRQIKCGWVVCGYRWLCWCFPVSRPELAAHRKHQLHSSHPPTTHRQIDRYKHIFTWIKVNLCSHRRSDQLHRPDRPNSPTKLDHCLVGLVPYMTCSRPSPLVYGRVAIRYSGRVDRVLIGTKMLSRPH